MADTVSDAIPRVGMEDLMVYA